MYCYYCFFLFALSVTAQELKILNFQVNTDYKRNSIEAAKEMLESSI